VYAAARLLCANGARDGHNLRKAVFAYNHSAAYVDQVLRTAAQYAATVPGTYPAPNPTAATAIAYVRRQLGQPYLWGGDGPAEGGFDCSGLTQAAYAAAGIRLPRVAQDQYDAGPHVPAGVPLLPGDLLFFGTGPHHITHVGIYTGGGYMINAPRPHTRVRQEPARLTSPAYRGATRPSIRPPGGAR
jgi:cell wall-associated NlpC family hydrolase